MPSENDRQAQGRQTRARRVQGRETRRVQVTAAQAEQVQARWRARALRYVLIYLLMGSALVILRYQTREVYPQLSALREARTELQRQQKELSLTVQRLTGEQRVRDWALAHGMMPYAQATKQTQVFGPPATPPVQSAAVHQPEPLSEQRPALSPLTSRTVWR